jgi:hypothetical protein
MKKALPLLVLIGCAALFAGSLFFLLQRRFASGDVYPPSSSLRSDPLGTMLIFESLQALPGVQVSRDQSAVNRLPDGNNTTYMHFAATAGDWTTVPADTFRIIDRFLLEGGRLVITLSPKYRRHRKEKKESDPSKEETQETSSEKKDKKPKEKKKDESLVSLEEKWGLCFSLESDVAQGGVETLVRNDSMPSLPAELKWHGETVLKKPGPAWNILYRSQAGPVLAEMRRGPGSVVVATDSFFVSNEALVRDRQPALLAWLVGSSNHVVFDEAHFGIVESPGLASLIRKYRLHGGVVALILLAFLFLWKSSSSLVPRHGTTDVRDDAIPGRNASAGFVGLLRRNIPKDRVLEVCLQEWRKSFSHSRKFSPREKSALEEIVREEEARPTRERDPSTTYQRIRAVLSRGLPSSHS